MTDFPSFSPTRYSSKSILDRQSHKSVLEKLVKHFDSYGFPQPLQGRDVGPIRDWRFLAGDTNSRAYEVDKADKQIGTNFGRVLYWLICSAHRMPSGMAVVGYLDQHIALIRFLGSRFGYRVLNSGGDLNMSGPHQQMNKKLRNTFDTWVIIMPSETLIAERQNASHATSQAPAFTSPQPQATVPPTVSSSPAAIPAPIPHQSLASGPVVVPVSAPQNNPPVSPGSAGARHSTSSETSSQLLNPANRIATQPNISKIQASNAGMALQQLNEMEKIYLSEVLPSCDKFIRNPPDEVNELKKEYFRLTETLQSAVLFKIDAVEPGPDEMARLKRKALVDDVQATVAKLNTVYREASKISSPPSRPSSMASVPSLRPTLTGDQSFSMAEGFPVELAAESVLNNKPLNSIASPPWPELGGELPSTSNTTISSQQTPSYISSPTNTSPSTTGTSSTPMTALSLVSALQPRPSVLRRKAPPPPKKIVLAKALYDFEPEEEGGEELNFFEGDIIEIVEKNKALEEDGWCRARVKGQKRIGLAPLDYLEELPNQPTGPPPRPSRISSMTASEPIIEQAEQSDAISSSAASKLDTKIDITVSSINQSFSATPNTTSPAALPPNPSSTLQSSVPISANASAAVPPLDYPPPSYTAATSLPATSSINSVTPNQSSRPPAIQPVGKPTIQNQNGNGTQIPGRPSQVAGPNPPLNGQPPMSNRLPQGRPTNNPAIQYGSGMSYGPGMQMNAPGMQPFGVPHSGLATFVGLAQAGAGFAQAGAQLTTAFHGNSNNQSSYQQPPIQHEATGNTTNVYTENNSHNQSAIDSTANNSNTQNTNATTNTVVTNEQPVSIPPDSSVPNDASVPNNYDFTIPYHPPESTAAPNYDLNSTCIPPNSGTGVSSATDPVTTAGSGSTADPNLYATVPPVSTPVGTMGSGPTSDPGLSVTAPPVLDPTISPFDSTGSYGTGTISPFATSPPPADPTQYSYDSGSTAGAVSPFASLATPDPATMVSQPSVDAAAATSPFASLAISDPAPADQGYYGSSAIDITAAETTSFQSVSPFAGLASNNTTSETTTVTSTTDIQSSSDAVSPFAGMTVTSTTDVQTGSGLGCGTGYADVTASTNVEVDTWTNTGGSWNQADYTATDSTSYGFSESYEF